MPLGALTIPSRRSVLTCRPNLPGGRFNCVLLFRPINDSKGSLRACLTSLSAAAGLLPGVLGFSTALIADFAGALPAFFLAVFPAGFPAGLAVCAVGLGAAGDAGLAACCAGTPAPSADFTLLGRTEHTCARKPGAAAIHIPSPRVIAERIVRSFPLRVSQPRRLPAWLQMQEPHPHRQAW